MAPSSTRHSRAFKQGLFKNSEHEAVIKYLPRICEILGSNSQCHTHNKLNHKCQSHSSVPSNFTCDLADFPSVPSWLILTEDAHCPTGCSALSVSLASLLLSGWLLTLDYVHPGCPLALAKLPPSQATIRSLWFGTASWTWKAPLCHHLGSLATHSLINPFQSGLHPLLSPTSPVESN